MVINMSELFVSDGMVKTYSVPLEMSEVVWKHRKYPIISKEPVRLELTHEGDRKIMIVARASLVLEMPCDRCLDAVRVPFDLEIERKVDAGVSSQERIAQLDEQPYIDGYNLDVDRLVWDEMMTDMPEKVLCREDCKGVCPQCGVNRNHQTCSCGETRLDFRMSVVCDMLGLLLLLLFVLLPAQKTSASGSTFEMYVSDTQSATGNDTAALMIWIRLEDFTDGDVVSSFSFSIPKSNDGAAITGYCDLSGFDYHVEETADMYTFYYTCSLSGTLMNPLLLLNYHLDKDGVLYPLMPTLRETARWSGIWWGMAETDSSVLVQYGDQDYGSIVHGDMASEENSGTFLYQSEELRTIEGADGVSYINVAICNVSFVDGHWVSSNPEVVSVSSDGRPICLKCGTAVLTYYDNFNAATITVNVMEDDLPLKAESVLTQDGGSIIKRANKVGRKLYRR